MWVLWIWQKVSGYIFMKSAANIVNFKLKIYWGPTYSDSNNKVAEIAQVHISLCVVALLGEAGPEASCSFCSDCQDGDGLNGSHLQGRGGRQRHKIGGVIVLAAGQLQLLTNWELQENSFVCDIKAAILSFRSVVIHLLIHPISEYAERKKQTNMWTIWAPFQWASLMERNIYKLCLSNSETFVTVAV